MFSAPGTERLEAKQLSLWPWRGGEEAGKDMADPASSNTALQVSIILRLNDDKILHQNNLKKNHSLNGITNEPE